jgi:hypothetical protein
VAIKAQKQNEQGISLKPLFIADQNAPNKMPEDNELPTKI